MKKTRTEAPEPGGEFDVATFIRENDRRLRRRIARCIGSRGGELDDVMQTTYVRLWQAASRIESTNQARGYCVLAATNIARDNARRCTPIPTDLPPDAAGLAPDPADEVIQREAVKILAAAVLALTPEQRRVWVSRELHGLTYAAIGSTLSLSPAAVRGLLERARAAVQRHVLTAEALVRDGFQAIVIHVVTARSAMSPRPRSAPWVQTLVAPAMVLASAAATPTLPGSVREPFRAEAALSQPAPPRPPVTTSSAHEVRPYIGNRHDRGPMDVKGTLKKTRLDAVPTGEPDLSCVTYAGSPDCTPVTSHPDGPVPTELPIMPIPVLTPELGPMG